MRLSTGSVLRDIIDCVSDLLVELDPTGISRFYDGDKAESPMQGTEECAKFQFSIAP